MPKCFEALNEWRVALLPALAKILLPSFFAEPRAARAGAVATFFAGAREVSEAGVAATLLAFEGAVGLPTALEVAEVPVVVADRRAAASVSPHFGC